MNRHVVTKEQNWFAPKNREKCFVWISWDLIMNKHGFTKSRIDLYPKTEKSAMYKSVENHSWINMCLLRDRIDLHLKTEKSAI